MNLLLAGYKPPFLTSNAYLNSLKKRYQEKSAGYLGTLDPFAKGMLMVAFGQYTRLFPYLPKHKKIYRAVLWLGLVSESLDMENIKEVRKVDAVSLSDLEALCKDLIGKISYIPPRFSAKHIQGKRAYHLARKGIEFELKAAEMEVFDLKILNYCHPFVSFEVSVDSGTYVRSLGEIMAKRLGCAGALCSLERLAECGIQTLGEERILRPFDVLNLPILSLPDLKSQVQKGQKFHLQNQENGLYVFDFEEFFSIIEVKENEICYHLNRIYKH